MFFFSDLNKFQPFTTIYDVSAVSMDSIASIGILIIFVSILNLFAYKYLDGTFVRKRFLLVSKWRYNSSVPNKILKQKQTEALM